MSALHALSVLRPRTSFEILDLGLAYARTYARALRRPLALCLGLPMLVSTVGLFFPEHIAAAVLFAVVLAAALRPLLTQALGRHLFGDAEGARRLGPLPKAVMLYGATGTLLRWLPMLGVVLADHDEDLMASFMMIGGLVSLVACLRSVAAPCRAEVALLEGTRGKEGRARGSALAQVGHARALRVMGFVLELAGMIAGVGAMEATSELLQVEALGLGWLGMMGGYLLASGFGVCVRFFAYIDARTRAEGWDLQVRFQNMLPREQEAE